MIIGRQNKGFTLVEVIVAVVISAFVALNLFILSGSVFKLHRNTKLTAQLEIESQMIMNNVKKTVQESKSFSYLEKDNKKAYKFKVADNKTVCYVVDESGNIYYSVIADDTDCFDIITDDNYLGQYVSDLTINENCSYDVSEKELITVNLIEEKSSFSNTITELVRLRDSK